jgi:mono/diheme cytochrome c family protein
MPTRFVTRRLALVLAGALLSSGVVACARSVRAGGSPSASAPATASTASTTVAATPLAGGPGPLPNAVARGKWLVTVLGCNDCHTPRLPEGRLDPAYLLAGHKTDDPYPAWNDSLFRKGFGMLVSTSGTAFAGPWGVTFARNLTPDKTTGIGGWNEEAFINVLREGTLKPPMPLAYGQLADSDLKAMYAYLASLPPVKNLVPFRQLTPPRLPGEIPGKKP